MVRYAIAGIVAFICFTMCTMASGEQPARGPYRVEKKLIEYGWDVPTPAFIADNIDSMVERPFDGLIFKLEGGGKVLEPQPWDESRFEADYRNLSEIDWGTFTDNFVIMWAASDQDWFNDAHWEAIEHNVRLVAKAARTGCCAGICFDPEPYGSNPWSYEDAPRHDEKSYEAYEAKVRERGAQFLRAIESELPEPRILTFFQLSVLTDLCVPLKPEWRAARLSVKHYALLPAFLEGMLDAAHGGVSIIDGNEGAYYYTQKEQHFRAYHTISQRARYLVAPALWRRYNCHVHVGQALYIDQYFGLRDREVLGYFMTPAERPKWLEHNAYWALYTTDRYVWCYSERMNWWKDDVPAGCQAALESAREKIAEGKPLGFELAPVIRAAEKRHRAEQAEQLTHRSVGIERRPPEIDPPKIDGVLDDELWHNTKPLAPFLPLVSMQAPLVAKTRAKVAFDARALYVSFQCEEPCPDKMRIKGEVRDDYVFGADVVEVFVGLPDSPLPYVHLAINPQGVYWDAIHYNVADTSYDPEWDQAAAVDGESWRVEMSIPWEAVRVKNPQSGTELRANLCRERAAGRELSSWSGLVSGFLEPHNFGTWVLE